MPQTARPVSPAPSATTSEVPSPSEGPRRPMHPICPRQPSAHPDDALQKGMHKRPSPMSKLLSPSCTSFIDWEQARACNGADAGSPSPTPASTGHGSDHWHQQRQQHSADANSQQCDRSRCQKQHGPAVAHQQQQLHESDIPVAGWCTAQAVVCKSEPSGRGSAVSDSTPQSETSAVQPTAAEQAETAAREAATAAVPEATQKPCRSTAKRRLWVGRCYRNLGEGRSRAAADEAGDAGSASHAWCHDDVIIPANSEPRDPAEHEAQDMQQSPARSPAGRTAPMLPSPHQQANPSEQCLLQGTCKQPAAKVDQMQHEEAQQWAGDDGARQPMGAQTRQLQVSSSTCRQESPSGHESAAPHLPVSPLRPHAQPLPSDAFVGTLNPDAPALRHAEGFRWDLLNSASSVHLLLGRACSF